MPQGYQALRVWQSAMDLACAVYRFAKRLPGEERFGLARQMRRAAVSVPSNIAEGYERPSRREYLHFLAIAQGSLAELESQALLAARLGYCPEAEARALLDNEADLVGRQLRRLRSALNAPAQERSRGAQP